MTILLKNLNIVDGTNRPAYKADILLSGDTIRQIRLGIDVASADVIDCAGLTAAPGFIDTHTHDDAALISTPDMKFRITQGVTTVVVGNCGISMAPLLTSPVAYRPFDLLATEGERFFPSMGRYVDALRQVPPAVNFIPLIGHGALRVSASASPLAPPGLIEIDRMCSLLEESLQQGAGGLSLGIEYPIGQSITQEEAAALFSCVHKYHGFVSIHIRTEGDGVVEAIQEAVGLNPFPDLPLLISHHKCAGKNNFNKSLQTLPLIEAAAQSCCVALDAYPYTVASTILQGNFHALSEKTIVTISEPHPELCGKTIADIAAQFSCEEVTAIEKLSPAKALYYVMSEEDVKRILAHPLCMVGSDGIPGEHPHPRLWGTFPRFLSHYVRELGLMDLPQAIHRITAKPAAFFGLKDRGCIKEGYKADLVIFDPLRIRDRATFEDPEQPSEGIAYVFVNGQMALSQGICSGENYGLLAVAQATSRSVGPCER